MTVSRKGTTAPRQNEISIDTNEGFKAAQFKVEQSWHTTKIWVSEFVYEMVPGLVKVF